MNKLLRPIRSNRRRRKGALTVQFVLLFPFLLITLVGGVQFSQIIMAGQIVSAAASVGAREASAPGATAMTVENAVKKVVADWNFASDPSLTISVEAAMPDNTPIPLARAMSGDFVAVTVQVDTTAAVSDMLKSFGITFAGSQLKSTFIARKE